MSDTSAFQGQPDPFPSEMYNLSRVTLGELMTYPQEVLEPVVAKLMCEIDEPVSSVGGTQLLNIPQFCTGAYKSNTVTLISFLTPPRPYIQPGRGSIRIRYTTTISNLIEHYPKVAKGYDNEYKAYVEITVDIDGPMLTIGTAHLSYTHRFINYPRKRNEVDKLLSILDNKKSHYIFSGDLNSRPGSYAVKGISRRLKHAGPKFDTMTWTTKPFSYRGFEETDLNWRLDYVFATRDVKVLSSKVVDTSYSDHLPILTTFTLGARKGSKS